MNDHIRRTLCGFLAAAAFFAAIPPRVAGQQAAQETYRIVRRLALEQNEPVTIRTVTVKGQSISTNEKFLSSDGWLNGLKITVENSSDKKILLASVQLQFPRPDGSKGLLAVYDLSFGNSALVARSIQPDVNSDILAPRQRIDLQVSASDFDLIARLLAFNGYKGSIEEVAIRIGHIIFADDTMWYAGSYMQRDPSAPGTWTTFEGK
jgi:hypothetical protein